jgi:hypothetical protein
MRLTNLWVHKTLLVLIVLLICSCNLSQTRGISQLTQTSKSTPSAVPTISVISEPTITETSFQSDTFYSQSQVNCSKYIQFSK